MYQTAAALNSFFNSFGIPAYIENNVPEEVKAPYIDYELAEPDWVGQTTIHANVWYRDSSFVAICRKVDEIKAAMFPRGVSIQTESGVVYLWPDDNNWAQNRSMEGDPTLKCMYLSLILQANTN